MVSKLGSWYPACITCAWILELKKTIFLVFQNFAVVFSALRFCSINFKPVCCVILIFVLELNTVDKNRYVSYQHRLSRWVYNYENNGLCIYRIVVWVFVSILYYYSEFVRMMMFNFVSLILFINIYVDSCEYTSLSYIFSHDVYLVMVPWFHRFWIIDEHKRVPVIFEKL